MSIDKQSRTEIIELVVGMFDGAPGAQYLSELMEMRAAGWSLEGLAEALTQSPAFAAAYSPVLANDEFAAKFVNNLLGDLVAAEDKAWSTNWVEANLNAGSTKAEVIMTAIAALKGAAGTEQFGAAAAALANKVDVAEWYSVEAGKSATSLEELQGVLAGVTNDPATVDTAKGNDNGGSTGGDDTLTQQADNVSGDAGDNIFLAPVTQNETGSGALANTFETGDVIKGGAGNDTLRADLIATGTIQDGVNGTAISAETDSVENIVIRAQARNSENGANNTTGNTATIDAEKMAGVEQWWTDNSRANVWIEDIRNNTSEVTFGMRQTDPSVSFINYFNPMYLEGDVSATSAMTLNIYEGDDGEPNAVKQLEDITVREISFTVNDEQIVLESDEIRAANTWDELETALNAKLEELGVSDSITLTNLGNGQFVFEDNEGREFSVNDGEALVLSVASNLTVTNSLEPGREEIAGPTTTNVVLDAAGNGSQGGTLNIGAMSGGRGVEVFNIDVDRDSHLSLVQSVNGAAYNGLVPNEYLEVVNLNSIGAKGDLQIGTRTNTLDERAALSVDNDGDGWLTGAGAPAILNPVTGAIVTPAVPADVRSGLYNVREVNGSTFEGDLNIAIALDNNVIARYLDEAEGDVEFNYTASAGNDLFNIADLSTQGMVSQDQDFTMNIDMGAGDDRLVINVPFVDETTVDGGEGVNSIVVSQSHGINASNTFESFANFQTYEVEGNQVDAAAPNSAAAGTTHDFTSMQGITDVIVATDGTSVPFGSDTMLRNLEADQNVTVSGKNQTIGNNSTSKQDFNVITLRDDAGVERTVTLDNTARLSNAATGTAEQDGVLFLRNLTIDSSTTGTSATTELTIDSAGERNVANSIGSINAAGVNTLNLTGTQELTVDVMSMATSPNSSQAALNIDASTLEGDLSLALNGTQLNQITGTGTDTVVGTEGTNDTFMVYGALAAGNNASVTGSETIQIGSGAAANILFGDLDIGAKDANGALNTAGISADHYVVASLDGTLTLNGFGNAKTIDLGDANTDVNGATTTVDNQTLDEQIDIVSSAANAAGTLSEISINRLDVIATGTATNISIGDSVTSVGAGIGGYRTINLDVARDSNLAATAGDVNDINLAVGSQARTLIVTGGQDGRSNVTQNNPNNAEVQIMDFAGSGAVTAAGDLTIGSYTFNLGITGAPADDVTVAADIATAINGQDVFGTGSNVTAVAEGTEVRIVANAADAGVNVNEVSVSTPAGSTLVTASPIVSDVSSINPTTPNTQLADTLDFTDSAAFTDDLLLALETIDLSGYNGQVALRMEQGVSAAEQTDVHFVMNGYDANITLSNGTGALNDATDVVHNSVFEFTEAGSVANPTTWTIDDIVAAGLANANVNNATLFDLTDLGITNFAQVELADSGFSLDGTVALNANTIAIRSEAQANVNGETWEIIVTGVETTTIADITADNFIFV